jgi:cation transport ATPase
LQLRDTLRPGSRALVTRLQEEGLRIVMLTGDRAGAATKIAEEAGVGEVSSQLKPEHKVAAVQDVAGVGQHDRAKIARAGGGVDRPAEARPHQFRQQPRMVDMGVGKNDVVKFLWIKSKISVH